MNDKTKGLIRSGTLIPSPRKILTVNAGSSDEKRGRAFATQLNSPELAAYRVISIMQPKNLADEIDTPTLLDVLKEQSKDIQGGDMAKAESMLINQAEALQSLFVRMCEQSMAQSHMPNLDAFMRLALRAQSQCRATIETLANIKNPPILFAKQANVTTGPQQINNGTVSNSDTRAEEINFKQTQLSGKLNELPQNKRASSATFRNDKTLEAVGKIDRTKVSSR